MQTSPAHRPSASGSNEKDSWEDVADNSNANTPATTPEDEDNSIGNDENNTFVPASKPRTKVKPKVEEATTTEKEHVNVVFIGHVGTLTACKLQNFPATSILREINCEDSRSSNTAILTGSLALNFDWSILAIFGVKYWLK